MERQASFDRIISGAEDQKHILEEKAKMESLRTGKELFGEYLVNPDNIEALAINEAIEYANTIARQYGATRVTDPERVFLLKIGGVEALTKGEIKQGMCNALEQSIAVDRAPSNALLAMHVVHESFHMSSFQAAQITKDGADYPYRSGIEMRGRKKDGSYFSDAQEAIIALLSKRFFDEVISKDPTFSEEIQNTITVKEWLATYIQRNIQENDQREKLLLYVQDILLLPGNRNVDEIFKSEKDDQYKFDYFRGYFEEELREGNILHERKEERDKFDAILDNVIKRSTGQFTNRQELFDEFARSHFTGNYLPLARKIEGVLGKGAFRNIAETLGEIEKGNQ